MISSASLVGSKDKASKNSPPSSLSQMSELHAYVKVIAHHGNTLCSSVNNDSLPAASEAELFHTLQLVRQLVTSHGYRYAPARELASSDGGCLDALIDCVLYNPSSSSSSPPSLRVVTTANQIQMEAAWIVAEIQCELARSSSRSSSASQSTSPSCVSAKDSSRTCALPPPPSLQLDREIVASIVTLLEESSQWECTQKAVWCLGQIANCVRGLEDTEEGVRCEERKTSATLCGPLRQFAAMMTGQRCDETNVTPSIAAILTRHNDLKLDHCITTADSSFPDGRHETTLAALSVLRTVAADAEFGRLGEEEVKAILPFMCRPQATNINCFDLCRLACETLHAVARSWGHTSLFHVMMRQGSLTALLQSISLTAKLIDSLSASTANSSTSSNVTREQVAFIQKTIPHMDDDVIVHLVEVAGLVPVFSVDLLETFVKNFDEHLLLDVLQRVIEVGVSLKSRRKLEYNPYMRVLVECGGLFQFEKFQGSDFLKHSAFRRGRCIDTKKFSSADRR